MVALLVDEKEVKVLQELVPIILDVVQHSTSVQGGDTEVAVTAFDILEDLVESIRVSGQQLPALLRYRRGAGPRYEVVYGRRRIAACREKEEGVRAVPEV